MTKKFNQLNQEQRYKIEVLVKAGKSQSEIALAIGVHKSTVSRELRRNTPQRGVGAKVYDGCKAHQKARQRHLEKPKKQHFTPQLKAQARNWITGRRYSPELVAAQWKKDGTEGVSHETIYKFIWECKHGNKRENQGYKQLYKHLKHCKRRRKRGNKKAARGIIPNRVPIEKRPEAVEKRKRFGDIEVDLIMGKNHQSALLVTVDRATLKTTIDRMEGKSADKIAKKIIRRMKKYPPIKTMTFDNDLAFAQHEKIAKELKVKTYFTRPYTSQDKGTIENKNGIIRMFYPKKTDFSTITDKHVREVEKLINKRPVRKFKYKTPNEVFLHLTG